MNLPSGWSEGTLGELCQNPQYGWTTKAQQDGDGPKLLRTTDITKGSIDWDSVPYCQTAPPDFEKYRLRSGDLVISRAGSIGFSCLIHDPPPALFASYLIRFRPRDSIDAGYLAWFLKSPTYWRQIDAMASGIALKNINAKKLQAVEVPVAPHEKQRAIVQEIDKHWTRLDAAGSALKRARGNLKRYRAAVLQAVVTGNLLRTALHGPKPDHRLPKGAHSESTIGDGDQGWATLPEGWEWRSLKELTTNHDGRRIPVKKTNRRRGPYPYYGASGVIDYVDRYIFEGDFLLVAEDGANLLSRTTPIAFRASGQFWVNNHAHVLEAQRPVRIQYLEIFLNGLDVSRYVSGTAQPKLTQASLNTIPVPVPPLAEQDRMMIEAERRLSVLEEMEGEVEANLKRAEAMRQAILARAFSGDLV